MLVIILKTKIDSKIAYWQLNMRLISIASLIFIFFISSACYAQRCGDHLWFSLSDSAGKPIDPAEYGSIKIVDKAYDVNNAKKVHVYEDTPEVIKLDNELKVLSIRTGCGLIEAKFIVEYKGDKMVVIIKDIPGDAGNFILKEFTFMPGEFEVNIHGRPIENCTIEHNEIVSGYQLIEEQLWRINNASFVKLTR
jgi:hypothetical protein